MSKVRPVEFNKIIGGIPYFTVNLRGAHLEIKDLVPTGNPFKIQVSYGDDDHKKHWRRDAKHPDPWLVFTFVAPGIEHPLYRIFRFDCKTLAILKDIVDRQDMVAYMGIIGVG